MKRTLLTCFVLFSFASMAQITPEIYSWIQNTNGDTGYAGILSNVQQVQYSTNNVYVSCTCIPGYDIGPWTGNPNIPANQNFVFKITRNPQPNTGTPTTTPMGHIGTWSNGVSMFNPKDGMSYNNQGIWNRNAIVAEAVSFDNCLGHPAPNGEYHHHLNPTCLYDDSNATVHSPIIGYAFDGYPVYGAFGYDSANGNGGIRRMSSSYRMRSITTRTTLPNGTVLNASQYGPAVNTTYPLGLYLEDFEYVAGLGDLDDHNGRFCVTPDYPQGTYVYFVTLDSNLVAAYPYVLGLTYYGIVMTGNTGPGSGHNIISEPVVSFVTGISPIENTIDYQVYPNPVTNTLVMYLAPGSANNMHMTLKNMLGQDVFQENNIQPAVPYYFNVQSLSKGIYFLTLESGDVKSVRKIIKQ
jgi:hypothetical protein